MAAQVVTPVPEPAAAVAPGVAPSVPLRTQTGRGRPRWALARLAFRSCRTGAVVVVLAVVGLIAGGLAAVSESAAIQGLDLASLVDNPAIRALYGYAYDLNSPGGFVTWRYGQVLSVVLAVWAMLTTTRLLRGDEESGRTDLVLAGPTTRVEVIAATGAVLLAVAAALTLGLLGAFLADGQEVAGSVLFAAGYGLVLATSAGVGAVTAQVFSQRRRAAGVAGALVAGAYLLRMAADASSGAAWLRWLTPFGWLELLKPFAVDDPLPLVPLAAAPLVLGGVAVVLAGRRDLGEGLVRDAGSADERTRGLHGAAGFALRQRVGGVIAWTVGVAVFGLVIGGITSAFVDFTRSSPSFDELAASFGMASLSTAEGFIATMDTFAALLLVAYVITSVHTLWEDEGTGRLDLVFAAPVTRTRWLCSAIGATAVGLVVLGVVTALTTWMGVLAGGATIGVDQSLAGIANLVPIVVLFGGIAFALHGTFPSSSTPVTSAVLVGTYLLSFLGPALDWPAWVLDLSPFHHLAMVPAAPAAWGPAAAMTAVGVVATAIGLAGYARRDLTT